MKRKLRPTRLLAALLALGLIAAACSSSSTTSTTATTQAAAVPEGGTLIDGAQLQADNLTSYDPGQVQTLDESQVTTAIYDGLTEFDFTDKSNPVLKGQVAQKWESNADATEYTFTLKPGPVSYTHLTLPTKRIV